MDRKARIDGLGALRKESDASIRGESPRHHIDPGFINKRLCFSVFGNDYVRLFEQYSSKSDHWQARLSNHHLMVDMALRMCERGDVQPLGQMLENPRVGRVFCSTERLEGTEDIWGDGDQRIKNRILIDADYGRECFLSYNLEHFVADTGKSEQAHESYVSIIGTIRRMNEKQIEIHPLIMGAPTFEHQENEHFCRSLAWYGYDLYEIYPEDIQQFSKITEVDRSTADWKNVMRNLSEEDVKNKIAEILGDEVAKDWAGETQDHYSTSITVTDKRRSVAFLLKGPSKFSEMTLAMCGKQADQISRLANAPADVLVVQHCHDVGIHVRDTLRAFAVQPCRPRHYCVIDGRDTFRILKAYGKL